MHSLIVWLFISFFRRFTSKFSWSSAWTSLNSFLNDWKWSVDSVNSSPFPARVPVNGLAKPARHNSWWRTKDGRRKSPSKQLSSPWDDTKWVWFDVNRVTLYVLVSSSYLQYEGSLTSKINNSSYSYSHHKITARLWTLNTVFFNVFATAQLRAGNIQSFRGHKWYTEQSHVIWSV